jgi:hypothetical protein
LPGFVGGTLTVTGGLIPDMDGTYSFDEFDGDSIEFVAPVVDGHNLIDLPIGEIGYPPFTSGSVPAIGLITDYNGNRVPIVQGNVSASTTVPEPGSLALLGSGLIGLLALHQRWKARLN